MVGRTFGKRYNVIEKIGKGGMADVYKAEDSVLNRTLAIKVLHPQFAQETNFVARFKIEAQAAAGLNHPNIVNIYDWDHEDETYFIAMEYLEGWNLKQLIEAQAPLPIDETLEIAIQVCSALDFAHQRGVIHRDIKSQNIIIAPHGQVKVADFGIARAGGASMTQTGSVMGTAEYISPEQAQGIEVGRATDIYSLGIVLYEALTGQLPFRGDSPVAVAMKQVREKPLSPSLLNSEISKPLEQVILRALEKNSADRYHSAEEMRQDLLNISKGLPVKQPPPPVETDSSQTRIMPVTGAAPAPHRKPNRKGQKNLTPYFKLGALGLAVLLGAFLIFNLLFGGQVVVPDLADKTLEDAVLLLDKSGLKLANENDFKEDDQKSRVVEQDPEAGVKIRRGGSVSLTLENAVTVPDVEGMTRDKATEAIVRAGLALGEVDFMADEEAEKDVVIGQLPKANKKVPPDTKIDLIVSEGGPKTMPNLINQSKEDAIKLLEQLGLKKENITIKSVASQVEVGVVVGQDPAVNEEIEAKQKITLEVSSGPAFVTMPNVKGMTEGGATAKLENLGLLVDYYYPSEIPDGVTGYVLDQTPAVGEKIAIGGTVVLTIGDGS